jgi:hypothetical protein
VNEKYKNTGSFRSEETNSILDRFLKLPLENLETRIKDLEKEISRRESMKAWIIDDLEHERRKLEDKMCELDFNRFNGNFLSRRTVLESNMLQIEKAKQQEEVACFRDIQKLKQELRFAREELKREREKSRLIIE